MIFIEKKLEKGYNYSIEEVFGKLFIESPIKLEAQLLDLIVQKVLRANVKNLIINDNIKVTYEPNNSWAEDDDNGGEISKTGSTIQGS
jgi:hypothetical protein